MIIIRRAAVLSPSRIAPAVVPCHSPTNPGTQL
jgi:hypothetical protein